MRTFLFLILKGASLGQQFPALTQAQCTPVCEGAGPGRARGHRAHRGSRGLSWGALVSSWLCSLAALANLPLWVLLWAADNPLKPRAAQGLGWGWAAGTAGHWWFCVLRGASPAAAVLLFTASSMWCWNELNVEGFFVFCIFSFRLVSFFISLDEECRKRSNTVLLSLFSTRPHNAPFLQTFFGWIYPFQLLLSSFNINP